MRGQRSPGQHLQPNEYRSIFRMPRHLRFAGAAEPVGEKLPGHRTLPSEPTFPLTPIHGDSMANRYFLACMTIANGLIP